ncbi:hypothetical protein LWI28_000480 [Acer negundo]|uniref:4-coumarate--CoA ligase n=1 Tax=Acer negundo TaxID=4023 RepID=A0AAD5ITA8_ACENE|nr:hypothetical protein LWI28_000480 [Acer negundo]
MAAANSNSQIDPNSGFCSETKIFHRLRPSFTLPPPSQPLSVTQFAFSLLHSNTTNISETPFLINAGNGHRVTFFDFLHQTKSLAFSLQKVYSLSKGDVAFILSPNSLQIPSLYFSLLSLGVIIAPANPDDSISELTHQIQLSRPSIVFATSHTSHKVPPNLRTVLIDLPEFPSLLTSNSISCNTGIENISDIAVVNQSDVAAILFSSGTTGRNKGVLLTHRNFIAVMAANNATYPFRDTQVVSMTTRALFRAFGLTSLMRAAIIGETLLFPETFELEATLEAVDKYKVTYIPVSPSFIVAMVKSDLTNYNLSSLRILLCGGAPLGHNVSDNFREKFPNIEIINGYGLTETTAIGASTKCQLGSVGGLRLSALLEAKIVDPVTGEILSPGQRGELWLRGPNVMKGYLGDEKATAEVLDSDGWLKTGDLCYFDFDGSLFILDRLKEMIKCNGYQVVPAELEHLLLSNSDIVDAAVVPYPDEDAGQIPMAFVVRKQGITITETQVMDFIAKQVGPYKKIQRLAFIDSIPKSVTGRILRRELVNYGLSDTTTVAEL